MKGIEPSHRLDGSHKLMPYEEIAQLFGEHGDSEYFGEPISQSEHALQSALLAVEADASHNLVIAALLHDIGHLLHGQGEDIANGGVDTRHEEMGEAWLETRFGPEVSGPVKLHVAAKRYLCAVNTGYRDALSPASVLSLKLQGGPMTAEEVKQFEVHPSFREAIRLRAWDDKAKIPGLPTPSLESYREMIEELAIR